MHEAFNPALYNNLGAAYAAQGELELALKTLERSLSSLIQARLESK